MNMSYCRFRNTFQDLRDCYYNMDESIGDPDEFRARKQMIELCKQIVEEWDGFEFVEVKED
jgi:hypothetical protein